MKDYTLETSGYLDTIHDASHTVSDATEPAWRDQFQFYSIVDDLEKNNGRKDLNSMRAKADTSLKQKAVLEGEK